MNRTRLLKANLRFLLLLISIIVLELPSANITFAQSKLASKLSPADKARNKKVDEAIVKALEFLSTKQKPSGAWLIDTEGESTAGTSLAVMAFMSAGHVPGEGPYGETMERGIRWVIDQQKTNGLFIVKRSHGPMYSHGICCLMLSEAVGMMNKDDSKSARVALEKGILLILKAQNVSKQDRHKGGWRYQTTDNQSDLSATGWQLLALRAAKDIGCDVPADSIDRAVKYVKLCSRNKKGGFGYQPGGGPSPTRSGTGILCLEVCGDHHAKETIAAADYLLKYPLREDHSYFFYGAYYCGVGMFKVGGKYWDQTKNSLSEILLSSQKTDGSWFGKHADERRHGRIYCTTLAVLSLAVEYRYLPIYQR